MRKEKIVPKKVDKHWSFFYVIDEFKKESDRASVILVAAVIDEKLTTLLKSKLIALPTANDDHFDGANAPISTFSSRIDLSFRLGLISSKFCRDLHLIRKIRNSFAHDIYGCNFENGGVKSRVLELSNTCSLMPLYHVLVEQQNQNVELGVRGVFLFITSAIIFHLNNLMETITPLSPIETMGDEVIYGNAKKDVEKQKAKFVKKQSEEEGA